MASRGRTDLIVVHCAATRPNMDIGVREIDVWHRNNDPPFDSIGYHAVIRRSGNLELGRPWDDMGAHVRGHNHHSVGVCLVGGLNSFGKPAPEYEPVQLETLRLVIDGLRVRYQGARVLGHRDLSPDADGDGFVEPDEWLKACPSFSVSYWWQTGEVTP